MRILNLKEIKEEKSELDIVFKGGKRLVREVTQKLYIVNEEEEEEQAL
jgi:hypothetical protein